MMTYHVTSINTHFLPLLTMDVDGAVAGAVAASEICVGISLM